MRLIVHVGRVVPDGKSAMMRIVLVFQVLVMGLCISGQGVGAGNDKGVARQHAPAKNSGDALARLGPYPYRHEGHLVRRARRCIENAAPNLDWPGASAEDSLKAWPYHEQPLPLSCWPLVRERKYGGAVFDEQNSEYVGNCSLPQDAGINVMARLTGISVRALPQAFGAGTLEHADEDAHKCRQLCYENVFCDYWQFRPSEGCFAQQEAGQVPYPLTSADVDVLSPPQEGLPSVNGEYIMHYCKAASDLRRVMASVNATDYMKPMKIVNWYVVQGDRVAQDAPVVSLQIVGSQDTFNATSPCDGVVKGIHVLAGEEWPTESVLADIMELLPPLSVMAPSGYWRVKSIQARPGEILTDGQIIATLQDPKTGKELDLKSPHYGRCGDIMITVGSIIAPGTKVAEVYAEQAPISHLQVSELTTLLLVGTMPMTTMSPLFSPETKEYFITMPMDSPFQFVVEPKDKQGHTGIQSSTIGVLADGTPACNSTGSAGQAIFDIKPLKAGLHKFIICTGFVASGQDEMERVARYVVTVAVRGPSPMLATIKADKDLPFDPPFSPDIYDYKVAVPMGRDHVTLAFDSFKDAGTEVQVRIAGPAGRRLQAGLGPGEATVIKMPDNSNLRPGELPTWDVQAVLELTEAGGKTSSYTLDLKYNVSTYSFLGGLESIEDPRTGKGCELTPKFTSEGLVYACSFWYTDAFNITLRPVIDEATCKKCTMMSSPELKRIHGLDAQVQGLQKEPRASNTTWTTQLTYGETQLVEFEVTAQDRRTLSNYKVYVERAAPFYLNAKFSQYFSRGITGVAWGIVLLSHGGGGTNTIKALDFMNSICSIQYTTELVNNFGREIGAINEVMEDHLMQLASEFVDLLPINVSGSFFDPTFWAQLEVQMMDNLRKVFAEKGADKDTAEIIMHTWFDYCTLRYSEGLDAAVAKLNKEPKNAEDLKKAQKAQGQKPPPGEPISCEVDLREVIDCNEFPVCPPEDDKAGPEVFWKLMVDFDWFESMALDLGEGLASFLSQTSLYAFLLLTWWLLRTTVERYTKTQVGWGSVVASALLALICGIVWATMGLVWAIALGVLGGVLIGMGGLACFCCARRRKGSRGVPNHMQALEPYRLWFFAVDIFIIANARRACLVIKNSHNFRMEFLRDNTLLLTMCQTLVTYLFFHVAGGCFVAYTLTTSKQEVTSVPGFAALRRLVLNDDKDQGDPVRGYRSSPEFQPPGVRTVEPEERSVMMQYNPDMEVWQDTNISHLSFGFLGRYMQRCIFLCTAIIPSPIGPFVRSGIRRTLAGLWLVRRIARECIPVVCLKGGPFNQPEDSSVDYTEDLNVDVYVWTSWEGWLPGKVTKVQDGNITVRYGNNESKTLPAVTWFSLFYPRTTLLKPSVEYAKDDYVQVYMTSPMFKWNKWADGVVDQIDTQSGDITVRCSKEGAPDKLEAVPFRARAVRLRPLDKKKEEKYENPKQWIEYKLTTEWSQACDEYEAGQGGFSAGPGIEVQRNSRSMTHTGNSTVMSLVRPELARTVEKAEMTIVIRSKAINNLEVGIADNGQKKGGHPCSDWSQAQAADIVSTGVIANAARKEKAKPKGNSSPGQWCVLKLTYHVHHQKVSVQVEDCSGGPPVVVAQDLNRLAKPNFYVTTKHPGDSVSIVTTNFTHRKDLEDERKDTVSQGRSKLYLQQHIEAILQRELFLRNFGIMWYKVEEKGVLAKELSVTLQKYEEDLGAECNEFVPRLPGVKKKASLAECAMFAKRMDLISRLLPQVVARANKRLMRGATKAADAFGPSAAQPAAGPKSDSGFVTEVPVGRARSSAERKQVAASTEARQDLCFFVDPPLTAANTAGKLVLTIESDDVEGVFIGITGEDEVPEGLDKAWGGPSALTYRCSDGFIRLPGQGDFRPSSASDSQKELRRGDTITLTYVVGDERVRGSELRIEDSKGAYQKLKQSLPSFESPDCNGTYLFFFVGITRKGRQLRIKSYDLMEPMVMWQRCLAWATEPIAQEVIKEPPERSLDKIVKAQLQLNAFLRRKGLKYMFSEALTFHHGAVMREGGPQDLDSGSQLRYKLQPLSKLIGSAPAEWVQVDKEVQTTHSLSNWQWICYEYWDRPWLRKEVEGMKMPWRAKLRKQLMALPMSVKKLWKGSAPLDVNDFEKAQIQDWLWETLLHECWIPKLQLGALVEYLREEFEADEGENQTAAELRDASTEGIGQALLEAHIFWREVMGVKESGSTSFMDNKRFVERVVRQLQEMVDWKNLSFWRGSDSESSSQVVVELDHDRFRKEDKRRQKNFYSKEPEEVMTKAGCTTPGELYDYTDLVTDNDGTAWGELPAVGVKNFEFCCPDGTWIQLGTRVELKHIPSLMRYVDGFRMCASQKNLNTPWTDMFSVIFAGRNEKDEFDWFIYTWSLLCCTVLVESLPMVSQAEDSDLDGRRRLTDLQEKVQDSVPWALMLIGIVIFVECWVMMRRVRKGESIIAAIPPLAQMIAVLGIINPWREQPPAPISSWLAIFFFLFAMGISVMRTSNDEGDELTLDEGIFEDLERTMMEYKTSETGGLNMFAKGRQGEIALARRFRIRVSQLGLLMTGQVRVPDKDATADQERSQKWPLKKLRYYEVPPGSRYRSADKHPRLSFLTGDVTNSFPVNIDVDQLTGAKSTPQIFASIQCLSPLSQVSVLQSLIGGRLHPEHDPVLTLYLPEREADREPTRLMDEWQKQIDDWFDQDLGAVREDTLADEIQEHLCRTLTEEALDPWSLRRFSIQVVAKMSVSKKLAKHFSGRAAYFTVLFDSEHVAVDFPDGRSSVLGRIRAFKEEEAASPRRSKKGARRRSMGARMSSRGSSGYMPLMGSDMDGQEYILEVPPFEVIPPASGRMRLALWAQVPTSKSPDRAEDELMGFTDLLDFGKLTGHHHQAVQKHLYCSWRLEGGSMAPLKVVPTVLDFDTAMVSYRESWWVMDRYATAARDSSFPMIFGRFFTSLRIYNYYDLKQIYEELLQAPQEEHLWVLQHERWSVWYLLYLVHLHGVVFGVSFLFLNMEFLVACAINLVLSVFVAHFSWFHVVRRDRCHGRLSSIIWFFWHLLPLGLGMQAFEALRQALPTIVHHHTAMVCSVYLSFALTLPFIATIFMSRASLNATQEAGGGFDLHRWVLPRKWRFRSAAVGQVTLNVQEVSLRSDPDEWGHFNEQASYVRDKLKTVTLTDDVVGQGPFKDPVFMINALRMYGVSADSSSPFSQFLNGVDLRKEAFGGPKFREMMQKVKEHLASLDTRNLRPGKVEQKNISNYVVWQDERRSTELRNRVLGFVQDVKHFALAIQSFVILGAVLYQASKEDFEAAIQQQEETDLGFSSPAYCLSAAGALLLGYLILIPLLAFSVLYADHPVVQNPRRTRVCWFMLLMVQSFLLLVSIFTLTFVATGLQSSLGELLWAVVLAGNCVWALLIFFQIAKLVREVLFPHMHSRLEKMAWAQAASRQIGSYSSVPSSPEGPEEASLEGELLSRVRAHQVMLQNQSSHMLHYVIVGDHLKPPARALGKIGSPASGRCPDPIVPHAARLGARPCMISLDPRDFTISWASPAETLVYTRQHLHSAFQSFSSAWAYVTLGRAITQETCAEKLALALAEDPLYDELGNETATDFVNEVVAELAVGSESADDGDAGGGAVTLSAIGALFSGEERGRFIQGPVFKDLPTGKRIFRTDVPKSDDMHRLSEWLETNPKYKRLEDFWALLTEDMTVEVKDFVERMSAVRPFVHAVESRWENLRAEIQQDIEELTSAKGNTLLTQQMLKPSQGTEFSAAAMEDYVIPLSSVHSVKVGGQKLADGPDERLKSIVVTVHNKGRESSAWKRFKNACLEDERNRFFETTDDPFTAGGLLESVEVHMLRDHWHTWKRVIHDCSLDPHDVANDIQDAGAADRHPSGLPARPTPEECWRSLEALHRETRGSSWAWIGCLSPGQLFGRRLRPGDCIVARDGFGEYFSSEDIGVVHSVYKTSHKAFRFNIMWPRTWKLSSMSLEQNQWVRHFKFVSSRFNLPEKPGPTLQIIKVKAVENEHDHRIEDAGLGQHSGPQKGHGDTEEARLHVALVNDDVHFTRIFGGGGGANVGSHTGSSRVGAKAGGASGDEVQMGTVVEVIEGLEVHVMTPDGEETIMVRHHPAQALAFGVTEAHGMTVVEATWLYETHPGHEDLPFAEAWETRWQVSTSDFSKFFNVIRTPPGEDNPLVSGDSIVAYWDAEHGEHSLGSRGKVEDLKDDHFTIRWDGNSKRLTKANYIYWVVHYHVNVENINLSYRMMQPVVQVTQPNVWRLPIGAQVRLEGKYPKVVKTASYVFSVAPALPPGLELNPRSGTIFGTLTDELEEATQHVVTMRIPGAKRQGRATLTFYARFAVRPPPKRVVVEVTKGAMLDKTGVLRIASMGGPSNNVVGNAPNAPASSSTSFAGRFMGSRAGSLKSSDLGSVNGATMDVVWQPELRLSLRPGPPGSEATQVMAATSRDTSSTVHWNTRITVEPPSADTQWMFECVEGQDERKTIGRCERTTRDLVPPETEDKFEELTLQGDPDENTALARIKVGWARFLSIRADRVTGVALKRSFKCEFRVEREYQVLKKTINFDDNQRAVLLNGDFPLLMSDKIVIRIIEAIPAKKLKNPSFDGEVELAPRTSVWYTCTRKCEAFLRHANQRAFELPTDTPDQRTYMRLQVWNGVLSESNVA